MKNIKTFNLKKAQQPFAPMGLNNSPELAGDELGMREDIGMEEESPQFQDGADLRDWLNQKDFLAARTELLSHVGDPQSQEVIEGSLNDYFEGEISDNGRVKLAVDIFELLPDDLKAIDIQDESIIKAPYVESMVKETNKIIKELAEKHVNSKKISTKSYNLKKTAQQKGFDTSVIMYGPQEKRLDPFYRQPVSNYNIVERNKGFGLVVDGIWDIDYEAIWRGAIMDKFSRPYRDNDGNWVGGYLNKRFEIDYNAPEASNYQLKPGQLRKPRPAEYGLTESRLQAARAAGEIEGGPAVDKSEPFNWKEAQSKKKVV